MQGAAGPLRKILMISPFPGGEGGRGDGAIKLIICLEQNGYITVKHLNCNIPMSEIFSKCFGNY